MNLDEMQLPGANHNEELETLSRLEFKRLFDLALFEIRDEDYRDKGIDCTIEIKANGRYTNFRINAQLKSTHNVGEKIENGISYPIYTANLEYLFNGGLLAYYFLYVKSLNRFYYAEAKDIIKAISEKNADWQKQKTHTAWFTKQLTYEAIREIYEHCKEQGILQRKLNEQRVQRTALVEDTISIDASNQVYSDSGIRSELEQVGFQLINEGRWLEIIELHGKATGNVASTARYNLILGIAYYHASRRFEALAVFKIALRLKDELTEEQANLLIFFDLTLRHSIGFLDDETFEERMLKLQNDKSIGAYVRIDSAKHRFRDSIHAGIKRAHEQFIQDLDDIIEDSEVNINVKLIAKSEKLYFIGNAQNIDYMKSIVTINVQEEIAGPDLDLRRNNAVKQVQIHRAWMAEIRQVKEAASEHRNFFAYYLCWAYQIKILYEFSVYADLFRVGMQLDGQKIDVKSQKESVGLLLPDIDAIINFYTHLEHYQNVCFGLSLKYEVLHYLENFSEAEEVLRLLESLVETYELKEQAKGLAALKTEGPTHVQFQTFLDNAAKKAEDEKKEREELISDMQRMDEKDSTSQQNKDAYYVDCFPMGMFLIPKEQAETFFEIANVPSAEIKSRFIGMWNASIIPVANILYLEVSAEGPREGNLADQGIDSWRNIYRIRKRFFEVGIKRKK